MRPTMMIWLAILGGILLVTTCELTYNVTNNSDIWTGTNAPNWETGYFKLIFPVAVIGFTVALIMGIWKGPKSKFSTREPNE